jgi:hypothetical protein
MSSGDDPWVNDFDRRWQKLIASARQAPAQRAPLSDLQAARLAALGLAALNRQRDAERAWRGMALAASLFLTCVVGLGVAVQTLVPRDVLRETLTRGRPSTPDTIFIPAPPRPPALASVVSQWSPARLFGAVGDWITTSTSPASEPSAQENAP